jgi:hypothetical protein
LSRPCVSIYRPPGSRTSGVGFSRGRFQTACLSPSPSKTMSWSGRAQACCGECRAANAARAAAADLVRLRGQYQGSATGDRCAELHARCSSDYLKAEAALRADFVQARSSALARSFARAPKHREPSVAMATGSPRPATRRVQNSGRAARQVLHASQPLPLCRRQARGCGPPCGRWKNGAR